MTAARITQQIRLWAYIALFLTALGYNWYIDRHSGFAFIVAATAIILPWLEVCGQCNHLAWWERGSPFGRPGPLWIGACKNCPPPEPDKGVGL